MKRNCPVCLSGLSERTLVAKRWDDPAWGDEYTDELHHCAECDEYTLVTFVDRFSSAPETRVKGPLSEDELRFELEKFDS